MSRYSSDLWLLPHDALATLADRAREARIRARLTQKELAERSGVTTATIQKLEGGGNVGLDTFLKVLHALGRLDDLQPVLAPPEVASLDELRRLEAERSKTARLPKRVRK